MNKKQLIIIGVIFVVLLIVSFFALKKEDSTWEKGKFADKTPLIEDLDVNKVVKFAIFNTKDRLELAAKDEQWVVYNRDSYPANYSKIRDFIMKVRDLKIAQKLRMKKNAYGSVKLLPPGNGSKEPDTGTLLVLYNDEGDPLLSLVLGDFHYADKDSASPFSPPMKDGRYVMVSGSDNPVLITDPLADASPDPPAWLNKKFLQIRDLKSISKIDPKDKKEWSISRQTVKSPFTIEGLKKTHQPNPKTMHETTSMPAKMKFTDVFPLKKIQMAKADTIEIQSFAGIKYEIKLAVKNKKAFAKFAISLDMPKKRQPAKKEKPEEKTKLDKAYEAKLKKARAKVHEDQFFTKWIYELPLIEANKLLINKDALYSEQEAPTTIMGQ